MKLVRESLFEFNVDNPYAAMGIGKRTMIEEWLNKYKIKNYTINDDLTIDVNNNIHLNNNIHINNNIYVNYRLDGNLPDYIQFNKVYGYFNISNCNLTSLKGCPKKILENTKASGNFYCQSNNLTSLEGCPELVEGDFWCSNNAKRFTVEEVKALCDVKGKVYV